MTTGIEQLNAAVKDLGTSFDELKNAHETATREISPAVKAEIDRRAEESATKFEQVQAMQAKLQAAFERGGERTSEDDAGKKKDADQRDALKHYLRNDDRGMTPEQLKQLSTDDNPNGGYLVPTGTLGMINARIFETSPIRRLADVRPTSLKSVTINLDDDEAAARWEGEGTTSGETATPGIGQVEIVAKKMEAEPRITMEDLQDSEFDMEAWLIRKVSEKMGRLENTAFLTGNGVTQPRGILTYDAGVQGADYVRGQIEQIANGSTTAITENGLIDLIGSLKEEYQLNATLLMKRATLVSIMKLAGTTNYRFLNLQPSGAPGQTGKVLAPSMMLLDRPVVLANDMPVVANGALPIAYGDFSAAYQILDRVGISVLRDPYTAKGRIKYYTTKRVGGGVKNFEAIKLLKAA
ncbi:phage major capsid protein [Methylorubrum sp. SB2]|uniref:phage major capsid protein n=1 Tax=Methylorubrum subtropicum TaxID=3138812 RepID=UPI00313DAEAA